MRLASGYGGALMLCEFIPGPDDCGANYNSFCVRGRPIQEFTAQKVRLKPTSIGFPTVVRSACIGEVLEAGRRMMSALELNGFSCMEFKRDSRDGVYKLMEVNARHNYSGSLATACGIDFPYLSYRAARVLSLPPAAEPLAAETFWIDEERDALGALGALWRGKRAACAYVSPYLHRKVYAVSAVSDPGPALSLLKAALGGAWQRLRAAAIPHRRARRAVPPADQSVQPGPPTCRYDADIARPIHRSLTRYAHRARHGEGEGSA
jgi:predicted ATP-grasp superfamily ATP-dependent carboligase